MGKRWPNLGLWEIGSSMIAFTSTRCWCNYEKVTSGDLYDLFGVILLIWKVKFLTAFGPPWLVASVTFLMNDWKVCTIWCSFKFSKKKIIRCMVVKRYIFLRPIIKDQTLTCINWNFLLNFIFFIFLSLLQECGDY